MNFTFTGKQITGFVTVVPKNVVSFTDEIPNYAFPPASSRKLQKMLGLETHEHDHVGFVLNGMFEMMHDASALAHAGR